MNKKCSYLSQKVSNKTVSFNSFLLKNLKPSFTANLATTSVTQEKVLNPLFQHFIP